jgi:hypothetical protein
MGGKLTLVVSNDQVNQNDKIIAAIRPLDSEVVPSEDFRKRMKTRLLRLRAGASGDARAA